jgi:hypothetical protein
MIDLIPCVERAAGCCWLLLHAVTSFVPLTLLFLNKRKSILSIKALAYPLLLQTPSAGTGVEYMVALAVIKWKRPIRFKFI